MAYLDKMVKQERTGSGITGINVDTSINNMINPVNITGNPVRATGTMPTYKIEIFDTIEKYAQEADKAKIANAKVKLSLDLEQARLDLEEKWSTVNDRFTNEERYNEFLQAKKDLLSEQEKIISNFKYMNKDEKSLALEKNKIHYREDYIKTQGTRNSIYTQQQIDEIDFNIEQAITLGGKQDIHSDGKAKEYLEMILELTEHKKNLAMLTDEQATAMVVGYVEKMETQRIANRLEEISISDMDYKQKLKELDKIKSYVENKEAMNYYAEKMVEKFPVENKEQAKQYFVAKVTDWSSKNIKSFKAQVRENYRLEQKAISAEARRQKEFEREQKRFWEEQYNKAYNSGSYNTMEYAITSKTTKGIRFDDRVANEISALENRNIGNSYIYHITGKSVDEIIARNEYIKDYVPIETQRNILVDRNNYMNNDNLSETEALLAAVNDQTNNNPKMTEIMINSMTANEKGYTKSIDVALKANAGDERAKNKLTLIRSIEKDSEFSPKLDVKEITEYSSTPEAKAMVDKMINNGVDPYTARKKVAEFNAGLIVKNYCKRNETLEVDKDILYLGVIDKKDKKRAKELLAKYSEDDIFIEAISDSATPRQIMKSTKLEGDLKL